MSSLSPRVVASLAPLGAVAAIYVAAAELGLSLATTHKSVSLVWPPTGVALAALLLFGYRLWPGIALGAFVANALTDVSLPTAAGIALGNTLEALVGASLLRRFAGFRNSLDRLQDALGLVALAAVLSTTVSATIGVTSLSLGGAAPWALYGSLWWQWWLGDAMGALVVAPVLLTWGTEPRIGWPARQVAEAGTLLVAVASVSHIVFGGWVAAEAPHYPLAYAIFPFVIWAALRFGPRGAATATMVISGIAIWGTGREFGPFLGKNLTESLMLLQIYMSVVAVTALVLTAAIAERKRGERRLVAQHTVTRLLAESPTLRDAVPRILQAVCECLGWEYGGVWSVDPDANVLRCVEVWHVPAAAVEEFEAASRQRTFPPGVGLPGRVWVSGQPAWIEDVVKDTNFPRAPIAAKVGLHGAFGFPILLGSEVLGVLEFFSREIRQPDHDLLQMFAAIGSQIGQFTERKRAEEALQAAHVELQATTRRAEEASRHKSEFLANMSHELRTPLNVVLGFSQMLQQQVAGALNEKQARHVNHILVSGRHLLAMINDILDLSKVEAGKLEIRRDAFPLPEALTATAAEFRPEAEAKGVRLDLEMDTLPPLLNGDPVRFQQILSNLLSNAVKFTPEGGHVTVAARRVQDGFVEIAVADTGIGIKAEDLAKLFQPFTQLEPPSTKRYQGTGLGLALTKRLVELHGGTIVVSSEGPGRGTTFTVRLPVAAEAKGRSASSGG